MSKITEITHPLYASNVLKWEKYRSILTSGKEFVESYLVRYSARETEADFNERQSMTFTPSFAKAALVDVRNAIFQRTSDIRRTEGPKSYSDAITGERQGVDLEGNSMDSYIGRVVLTELLGMSRVGVFIDKPVQEEGANLRQSREIRPYLYSYKAEDIRAWAHDENGELETLLLRDHTEDKDELTGLTTGTVVEYRLLQKVNGAVVIRYFDAEGMELTQRESTLKISMIPFALFNLSSSILEDAADYQIALLNMESSDIHYALKSNFPFYTEQYNAQADMAHLKGGAANKETQVGMTKGRRYSQGMDRPGFINPSSEPLEISMKKEAELKADIRRIVNLNVSGLSPTRSSAESKEFDNHGLESGLSYIGMELQHGENTIAKVWAEYEGTDSSVIKYPSRYNLVSMDERIETAKKVRVEMPMLPSLTYQKEMAKEVSTQMMGSKVTTEVLAKIHAEIDRSAVIVCDPDIIKQDHEAGFVSDKTASMSRLYPEGEHKQAAKDHAERAARIVMAQTSAKESADQARGANDEGNDPKAGEKEKKDSQDPNLDADGKKGVRS